MVGAGDDVRPVLGDILSARKQAGYAYHGHVERCGQGGLGQERAVQHGGAGHRHVVVEGGNGRWFAPQGGDLSDHVEAFATLLVLVDHDQVVPVTPYALGRHAQASEIEVLESGPTVGPGYARCLQRPALVVEATQKWGLCAAGAVARRRLEQRRGLTGYRRRLERFPYGPARHGLMGEQVGGPHEQADASTSLRQRRRHGCDHRGGPSVVDATGEEQVHALDVALEQLGYLLLPEHEAGPGTDVATALATLEDESPRSLPDEQREQPGRGDVQEGGDARLFERARQGWPAAGDERGCRAGFQDSCQLPGPKLGGHEAEDARSPRPAGQHGAGLGEQCADRLRRHKGQRQEG